MKKLIFFVAMVCSCALSAQNQWSMYNVNTGQISGGNMVRIKNTIRFTETYSTQVKTPSFIVLDVELTPSIPKLPNGRQVKTVTPVTPVQNTSSFNRVTRVTSTTYLWGTSYSDGTFRF